MAAAGKLDQPCVLSMSDHLYGAGLVRALSGVSDDDESCQLLVDGDVAGVFDIDDATKVRREGDRIVAIGKDLTEYDGIDCGVFRVTPALVEALGEAYGERGDCSLSDGVRRLCERDRMRAVAVSGEAWLTWTRRRRCARPACCCRRVRSGGVVRSRRGFARGQGWCFRRRDERGSLATGTCSRGVGEPEPVGWSPG